MGCFGRSTLESSGYHDYPSNTEVFILCKVQSYIYIYFSVSRDKDSCLVIKIKNIQYSSCSSTFSFFRCPIPISFSLTCVQHDDKQNMQPTHLSWHRIPLLYCKFPWVEIHFCIPPPSLVTDGLQWAYWYQPWSHHRMINVNRPPQMKTLLGSTQACSRVEG